MYLPNPVAIGTIKAATYVIVGALVRVRATMPGHMVLKPVTFGIVRAILGWLIGAPLLLIAIAAFNELSSVAVVAVLAVPRFILSCILIQLFFRVRGAWQEAAAWALLSVTTATMIDLVVLRMFEHVEWLRLAWC